MSIMYDPEKHPEICNALALAGKTDAEISRLIGISRETFHKWRKRYPELKQATDDGKKIVDDSVQTSLYSRACGMTISETKTTEYSDGSSKTETITKEIPPDTVACIFWMKNRRPHEWRDKQDVQHSGDIGVTIIDDIRKTE